MSRSLELGDKTLKISIVCNQLNNNSHDIIIISEFHNGVYLGETELHDLQEIITLLTWWTSPECKYSRIST